MMVGGVAYLYPLQIQDKRKKFVEWFGLVLIIGSYFFVSKDNPWPGYLAIIPVLGTFVIIQSQRNDSLITSNLISQKLSAWSYSIYLWHWPLVVAIFYFSLSEAFIYFAILLSLLLGFLSNKYIEKIKFKSDFASFASVLKYQPLYLTLIVTLLSSYVFINKGDNSWLIMQDAETQNTYEMLSKRSSELGNWGTDSNGEQDFSSCRFNVDKLTEETQLRLQKCSLNYGPGVLILGDSHAKDLFGMVASRFSDDFVIGVTSAQYCRPHTPLSHCQYEDVKQFISKNTNIFKHVIYEQGGLYLLLDENGNKGSREMFSKLALTDKVEDLVLDEVHISLIIDYLAEISEFVPITWFGSRVGPHFTQKQILQRGCDFDFSLRDGQRAIFDSLDSYIAKHISYLEQIKFMSQNEVLSYDFTEDFMTCKEILWDDGDHLSIAGEEIIGKHLPDSFLDF